MLGLKVNRKFRVRSGEPGDPGYVMIVRSIEGDKITAVTAFSRSRFVFYRSGDYYVDGTGKRLIIEPFRR